MLSPGIVLQKRYRIKRLLAQGGMGAVYEAEAVHLRNTPVAVKETFFNEDQKKLREQFEREAATLARLHHPALPQVKDHFIEGGGQFLVMDLIAGDDLGNLLDQRLKKEGEPFGFWQVMEWAERLLDALVYIHSQSPPVIHRDIKPQNLKLTPRGELFLIDFGLAKDATTPTRPGYSVHAYTLEFAPPEQIKGAGTDARSDIYSLGATLYHLVTGKLPPDARIREEMVVKHLMPDLLQPAHHVNPQVPFAFAAALSKAMALDREQRYQNAQEMWQALRQIKQTLEAEIAERERQEAERRRLEEEERKRLEEEARQREIEEQRRREVAARRQTLLAEINRKKEELAELELALQEEAATERIVERPVAEEQRINQQPTKHEAPEIAPKKIAVSAPPFLRPAAAARLKRFFIGLLKKAVLAPPPKPLNKTIVSVIYWAFPLIFGPLIAVLLLHEVNPTSVDHLIAKLSGSAVSNPTLSDSFIETAKGLNLEMVRVPSGSFMMGSPDNEPDRQPNEGPQHRVTVPSFYIGKYEVTQAQWRKVAGLPKVFMDLKSDPAYIKGDDLPVEQVSYWEAREFCTRLSRETNRGYRLPSEAEWEYAARAGTTTPFAFGSSLSLEQANFSYRRKTTPVGSFTPNAFKLHDMHGNVWEWCEDMRHDNYNGAPEDGSAWLSGGDSGFRALRGGAWDSGGGDCRSARRYWNMPSGPVIVIIVGAERYAHPVLTDPHHRIVYVGFRVVSARK